MEENIDIKKKRNVLILGIVFILLVLMGSVYAFYNYRKSEEAFVLTTKGITARFTSGTNQINFTNAYPMSDEFALSNLSRLSYIDFTVSCESKNSEEAIKYEIYLTEKEGNTLSDEYIKLYLVDDNGFGIIDPIKYSELLNTTYKKDKNIGKVVYEEKVDGKYTKNYRLYVWIDEDYSQNDVSEKFSFYVNLYAYNDVSSSVPITKEINYIEDLVDLSNEVNNGDTKVGNNYVLTRDLDFKSSDSYKDANSISYGDINGNGVVETLMVELIKDEEHDSCSNCGGFIPIGKDGANSFQGNFNGRGYRIDNLYENNVNHNRQMGLFGYVRNSTISNLTLSGEILSKKEKVSGSFIGISNNNVLIDSCHSEVNIVGNYHNSAIGGFVGTNATGTVSNLTISNSSNSGSISNVQFLGGFVGYNGGTLTINNSYNDGAVTSDIQTVSSYMYFGGLVGSNGKTLTINNSYNNGAVTGDTQTVSSGMYLGGLVGINNKTLTINNSYNEGQVINTASSSEYGLSNGGIIGGALGATVIRNTYNEGNVTGSAMAGGIVGIINSSSVIIDRVYNTGTIYSNLTSTGDYNATSGGLIGYTWKADTKIINSTNSGSVTGLVHSGGIIGGTGGNNVDDVKVINSYNTGALTALNGFSNGIISITDNTINSSHLNNVYNFGSLSGGGSTSGITYARSGTASKVTLANAYYLNTIVSGVTGETSLNQYTTSMSEGDIKSQTFVNTLNNNLNSINLSSIDSDLSSYTLNRWKLGSNGYPVFEWQQ